VAERVGDPNVEVPVEDEAVNEFRSLAVAVPVTDCVLPSDAELDNS
jgi:hypothetical protein